MSILQLRKDNYPFQSSHTSEGSLFATGTARLAMCKATPCTPRQAAHPAVVTVAGNIFVLFIMYQSVKASSIDAQTH